MGQIDEAVASLTQALALAQGVPDYTQFRAGSGDLAGCYLRLGKLSEALSVLETSQQINAEHNPRMVIAHTPVYHSLAEACLVAAEQRDPSERADWLNKADQALRTAFKNGKGYRGGRTQTMRLRGTYEWQMGKTASVQKWWQRSLAEAEAMGMRHDLGLTQLEMGQRLGNRAYLEKAATIFAEIRAEADLARVRELL